MKKIQLGIALLLGIIFWQFGNWVVNAIQNPSWLSFPTPIIVGVGVVVYLFAMGLILSE